MKSKIWFFAFALAIVSILSLAGVLADSWNVTSEPGIDQMTVYVDGNAVFDGSCVQVPGLSYWNCNTEQIIVPALERGSNTEVKVVLTPGKDMSSLEVRAWISGYHDDVEVETAKFDVFEGNVYTKRLNLELPSDLDAKDTYTLHVQVTYKNTLTGIESANIDTTVQRLANNLKILNADFFGSSSTLKAGSTIYADVVVKNMGNHDLDDIFVKASIKELGISRTVYVGDLVADEDCSSGCDEEDAQVVRLALTIPENAASGTYLLEIEAFSDETTDKVTKMIYVEKSTALSQPETVISVSGLELSAYNAKVDAESGKGTAFSVLVSNTGSSAMTVTLATLGTEDFASSQVNPSVFTLAPGESKTATVYLVIKENAIAGEHIFTVKASSENLAKQINLTADVDKTSANWDLKTILMFVGIVLAIAIVILLIVLLAKKSSAKVEESYY
ncbi:hypothetical protein J4465_00880 [Candidatus Pacearchaeota archaeon]|nr:hypothetical protein [Candidatus Pacearchaeota archaeon]